MTFKCVKAVQPGEELVIEDTDDPRWTEAQKAERLATYDIF